MRLRQPAKRRRRRRRRQARGSQYWQNGASASARTEMNASNCKRGSTRIMQARSTRKEAHEWAHIREGRAQAGADDANRHSEPRATEQNGTESSTNGNYVCRSTQSVIESLNQRIIGGWSGMSGLASHAPLRHCIVSRRRTVPPLSMSHSSVMTHCTRLAEAAAESRGAEGEETGRRTHRSPAGRRARRRPRRRAR